MLQFKAQYITFQNIKQQYESACLGHKQFSTAVDKQFTINSLAQQLINNSPFNN